MRLVVRAGTTAAETLKRDGFRPDAFSTLVGASGGPKWLVLSQMDRVWIESFLARRTTPLQTVATSIGSYRHACFAQARPRAAIELFEESYIDQAYDAEPTTDEVSAVTREILGRVVDEAACAEIIDNPNVVTHFIAARGRGLLENESKVPLMLGLAAAALANLVARPLLAGFFQRVVFHTARSGLHFEEFGAEATALTHANMHDVIMASGSVPLVMAGVPNIAGAPAGTYRDGGITDYHFDFRFRAPEGLVLFPHFFDRISPGWFDKSLRWRRPAVEDLDRVVMIAPSDEFIAALPGGRVPDRKDFYSMDTTTRQTQWRRVVSECRALADDLVELLEGGRIADHLRPFPRGASAV